ncbi:MAG: PAS-domain containing protein [Alphaproteobacteria bacterium]|nr:PAS-domain containing protein [Alphaproteobacteria bacterium]
MEPSPHPGLSGARPAEPAIGGKPNAPPKGLSLHPRTYWASVVLMGGAILALDVLAPGGAVGGFPYAALVLWGLSRDHHRHLPILAGIAASLAILGGLVPAADALSPGALANRVLALIAIGAAAFVIHRHRGAGANQTESGASRRVAVLETALSSMAQGFTAFDKDHRLIAFNEKVSDYFGYPPGFLRIGMSNAEIFRYRIAQGHFGDGDPEEILERLLNRSKNRSERTIEQSLANGSSHIFHRRPMPDGGYVNTYTDITRRKRAERDAAAKSEFLEAIFKTGGTGFYIVDSELNLVDYNEIYEELMGFPKGFLGPGLSLGEITGRRHEMGHFADRDLGEILARRRNFDSFESLGEHTLQNGRSYIYRRRPLPQGGFVTSFTETTALKKTQREAAEKSAYLEGILETGVAAFCIVNAEFNLVQYNKAYEKLFGFPKGFLRPGLSRLEITRFRHELGHFGGETLEHALERRTKDRKTEKFDERRLPDGRSYVYRRKLLPQGGYVTTYIETTALRQAREEAQTKSVLLDTALEIMGQGFIVFNSNQEVAAYNRKYLEMVGLPAGCDILGKHHEEVLRLRAKEGSPVERLTEDVIRKRIEGQRDGHEVIRERVRKDGTALIYHRVPLPGGGNVCTYTDITKQKQAETALRANQEQLTQAQEMAQIGSWELDLVTGRLTWSEEIYRMFGVNPSDFDASYEAFLEFVHPDDRAALDTAYKESIAKKEPYHIAHRLLLRDGSIKFVEERCQTWFDDAGRPLRSIGTVQDITEKKQTEEELHQAQKMEVIGQLTGGVAHDFNNLLAVIIGNTEMLGDELGEPDRKIDAVLHAASRGAELTQRLLSFSRRQPLFPRAVDTRTLIDNLLDLVRRTLGETITVTTRIDAELWSAHADPGQLENALLNLAINARDAMPDGGRLTIACSNAILDGNFAPVGAGKAGQEFVAIAVRDAGTGMSQEILDHAFEPFFTTKEVGEGSGLGLSMVYGFAKQSGGHVTIDSKEGWGTTVNLYLPRGKSLDRVEAAPRERAEPAAGPNARILVIEDDPQVQETVRTVLRSLGHSITTAETRAAAIDHLREKEIDLILSDVVLPDGTNDQSFIAEAQALHPRVKVVFMSGYPARVEDGSALEGSDAVLLYKPFTKEKLAQTIAEALEDSRPRHDALRSAG